MPVKKCSNSKYRIGDGECKYETKEDAEKAYKAYLAKKYSSDDLRKEALEKLSKNKTNK